MDQYRTYIRDLAQTNSTIEFYNSGAAHAGIVMSAIFDNAKNFVKIYAGGLTGEVSGVPEYRKSLQKFIARGGKVEVLLDASKIEKLDESEAFKLLKYNKIIYPNNIFIKTHTSKVVSDSQNEVHFTTADGTMYRLEEDIDKFTATGNFNNPERVAQMDEIFNQIFSAAEAKTIL